MNIASSFRMKEIDRISIEQRGFGDLLLMENAGIRILEEAVSAVDLGSSGPIVCIAGSGNNGGDALVTARQIFTRLYNPVTIIILKEKGSDAFEFNLNICRNLGMKIINISDGSVDKNSPENLILQADFIFDGITGTGLNGSLRGHALDLVELVNRSNAVRFAIDLPSGTGDTFQAGYTAVQADYTFTVGLPKRALYRHAVRPCCGLIKVINIGFPADLLSAEGCEPDGMDWKLAGDADIRRLVPVLKPGDYKNSRGHLFVFAGSPGTTGAASLCAEAALRTSSGMVSLFPDSKSYDVLAARHKAVIVRDENIGIKAVQTSGKLQPVVAGPGWGIAGREELLDIIISHGYGVMDADAVSILAAEVANTGTCRNLEGRWILTPHPGEFRRLFPDLDYEADPYTAVAEAAKRMNCIVLLKGITTFIADSGGRYTVIDGNYPLLGTAGSGDVLSGIIGGYAASGMDLFDAAVIGASVHLKAGRKCGEKYEWFTADMLIDYIGRRE